MTRWHRDAIKYYKPRHLNLPARLSLNFDSPLKVEIIADQFPVLVERSRCAGPCVNSFVLLGRWAILIPSDASVLREVQQQNVLLHLCAGARFQLWHTRARASWHFSLSSTEHNPKWEIQLVTSSDTSQISKNGKNGVLGWIDNWNFPKNDF